MQVDAFDGQVGVHQPGVDEGGERQEEEAEERNEEFVVGALQIGGREEHDDEHDAREGENEKHEQAGHEGLR